MFVTASWAPETGNLQIGIEPLVGATEQILSFDAGALHYGVEIPMQRGDQPEVIEDGGAQGQRQVADLLKRGVDDRDGLLESWTRLEISN